MLLLSYSLIQKKIDVLELILGHCGRYSAGCTVYTRSLACAFFRSGKNPHEPNPHKSFYAFTAM